MLLILITAGKRLIIQGFFRKSRPTLFLLEIFRAPDTQDKPPMIKTDDLWNNLKLFDLAET